MQSQEHRPLNVRALLESTRTPFTIARYLGVVTASHTRPALNVYDAVARVALEEKRRSHSPT
jgi:hypothetical protein